jgi:hypothetical protein
VRLDGGTGGPEALRHRLSNGFALTDGAHSAQGRDYGISDAPPNVAQENLQRATSESW